jgi:hypothetical protein
MNVWWRLESKLCSKLQTTTPPPPSAKGIRPCILLKFVISVMLRKAFGIDGIPRRPLVICIVLSGILDLVK